MLRFQAVLFHLHQRSALDFEPRRSHSLLHVVAPLRRGEVGRSTMTSVLKVPALDQSVLVHRPCTGIPAGAGAISARVSRDAARASAIHMQFHTLVTVKPILPPRPFKVLKSVDPLHIFAQTTSTVQLVELMFTSLYPVYTSVYTAMVRVPLFHSFFMLVFRQFAHPEICHETQ